MQPLTYIYIHLISSLNHYYTYLLYFLIPKKTFIFLLNLCHMASSPPSLNQKQEGMHVSFFLVWIRKFLLKVLFFLQPLNMFAEEAGMLGEKSISLEENVLQKHAAFFDINKDGVIYPWETFQGFHCFSFPLQFSTFFLLTNDHFGENKVRVFREQSCPKLVFFSMPQFCKKRS